MQSTDFLKIFPGHYTRFFGLPEENQSLFNSIARKINAAAQAAQYPQTQCSIVSPRKNFSGGAGVSRSEAQ
jgi:hypothetical protein